VCDISSLRVKSWAPGCRALGYNAWPTHTQGLWNLFITFPDGNSPYIKALIREI